MGACFSDVKGGREAVGTGPTTASGQGFNDAVHCFLANRGLADLCTPLELSVSASNLLDRDILSKSDPMAVLYVKNRSGIEEEIGRTEVIMNSLNPAWITKFNVIYQFEKVQHLVFRIYDIDSTFHNASAKMLKLDEQDFLGEASCALSEIVTKKNQTITLGLQHKCGSPRLQGMLTVHAEEVIASRKTVNMAFRCSNLKNTDILSKSCPFLRISRIVETGSSIPICKTEVTNLSLNPLWKPVTLTTQQYGSKDTPLIVECFHFDSSGNHELLGQFQGSVADFEKLCQRQAGANLHIGPSLHHKKKEILKAQLYVDTFNEKTQYSFLDYISSGFELNFMVAVDFTGSNGDPRLPESLHHIDHRGCFNSYQQAISGVGEVVQFYDSDKRFPAWGFGGKLPDGSVSHCFNLNGSLDSCEQVVGVEGIMAAYATALRTVSLHGPTLFGPVINRAADIASESLEWGQNKYFVLLIIADGVINDFHETKNALVRASNFPLSVLIVGVGSADFKEMQILDGDNRRLESSSGQIAARDIVQFVPMREMQGEMSIAQALLEELPAQFLSYMNLRSIKPLFARHGLTPY